MDPILAGTLAKNLMRRLARSAPAVQYPLRRSLALAVVLGCLLCIGAGSLAAWLVQGAPRHQGVAIAASGVWLVTAACALQFWWQQCAGTLSWDGAVWVLDDGRGNGEPRALDGPPTVYLDLQSHLWVCASLRGNPRVWLWIERSYLPERWMDLRRAVYSRAKPGAPSADATAPAHSREA